VYKFSALLHDKVASAFIAFRTSDNGVYQLNYRVSPGKYQVYCHMTEIDGCEGKGWTLVMKMNGTNVSKKQSKIINSYMSDGKVTKQICFAE
jgi:hypothetical protein